LSRSDDRTGQWFATVFAVLFTLLTPLSLAYPASFAIGGMEGIRLNGTIALEWLILLGLPLVGMITGLVTTPRRAPAVRFAMAAAGAFVGSLFVWAVAIAFYVHAFTHDPSPFVF
jgi:hypothetical protein